MYMLRINKILGSVIYLLPVLFFLSCKTKHIDSEPTYEISFIKADIKESKKFCFKKIHGKNNKEFENKCIDTLNFTLVFPININEKKSVMIFETNKKKDSLEVHYDITIGRGDNELKANVTNFRIDKTTFDSVGLEHRIDENNEIVERISIYF